MDSPTTGLECPGLDYTCDDYLVQPHGSPWFPWGSGRPPQRAGSSSLATRKVSHPREHYPLRDRRKGVGTRSFKIDDQA